MSKEEPSKKKYNDLSIAQDHLVNKIKGFKPLPSNIGESKTFELHYDFTRDYTMSQLISAFFEAHSTFDANLQNMKDHTPVITSVKQLDNDIIEVKRAQISKGFFNVRPYPEERILIRRGCKNPSDIVMQTYSDFGFKKEMTKMFNYGYMIRSQRWNFEKYPKLESPQTLELLNGIHMYKNLEECKNVFKTLDRRWADKQSLDNFGELRISDVASLV
jgi:hypothetical protein